MATQTDCCLSCGAIGTTAYQQCTGQIAVGFVPDCANKCYQQSQSNTIPNVAANVQQAVGSTVNGALSSLFAPLAATLPLLLERIGLFLFAMILVIVGFLVVKQ